MKFTTTFTRFDNMPRSRRQVTGQLHHARAMRLHAVRTGDRNFLAIARGALAIHNRWSKHMVERLPA